MNKKISKYLLFLILIPLLSIPFYIWGAFAPVERLPFNLPISLLMIILPFLLSLIYTFKDTGKNGIIHLFKSIFDINKNKNWALIFIFVCMPIVTLFTYLTMQFLSMPLPDKIIIPYSDIPFMLIFYFLGSILEEFGWTSILIIPLFKEYGPIKTGVLIGTVWAIWHIIPWSWDHSFNWIIGMSILDIITRTIMVYIYIYGGKSLFSALILHTMMNTTMGLFPNNGSHINNWVLSFWMLIVLLWLLYFIKSNKLSKNLLF